MKLRKVLSSVIAGALAVSATAISTMALTAENYFKPDNNGTVFINADKEGDPNWTADSGVAITDVYGVTYHLTFDEAEVADESTWIGGGIGANSNSTGWKQAAEWGRAEKAIIVDLSVGDVTWLSDEPIFAEDDAYAQFWLQTWGGTVTIVGVDILGKDGVVLSTEGEAAPADEAPAEAKWNAETVMVYQDSGTWTAVKSEPVTITADGEYTYSITGLDVDPSKTTVLYVKDAACIDETPSGHTTDIGNVKIECVSLKMNGEEITLDGDDDSAVDAKGILDYCLYNMWSADDTHFALPSADKLESVELTIKVTEVAADEAADDADDDAAAEDEDDADEADADEDDSEEDADDSDDDDAEAFEVDWDSFDQDAAEQANADFVFGVNDQIDLYSVLGEDIYDLAKVDATFTWTAGTGWCGGAGIGNGAVLEDGSTWVSGAEYGCANANAALVDDGKATQTILDITGNAVVEAASADEDGSHYASLFVQNWWNGVEAGAKLEKLTFLNADGDVIGELAWESEEAPAVTQAPAETSAPAAGDVAAATDSSKGSPDTGVADVAAVAGLAIVAGGAVLVAKKRK